LQRSALETLKVDSAEQSLEVIREVLNGQEGPARNIVCLNAAAALYVAGLSDDLGAGVALAQQQLESGRAKQVLDDLVTFSNAAGVKG
jgi:anthranilate phosphoribosyltransferase